MNVPDPAMIAEKLLGQWKLIYIEKGDTRQDVTTSGYLWEFLPDSKLKHKSGDGPSSTLSYTIGLDSLKIDSVFVGQYRTLVTNDGRKYFITKLSKKQLVLMRDDTKTTTIFYRVKN